MGTSWISRKEGILEKDRGEGWSRKGGYEPPYQLWWIIYFMMKNARNKSVKIVSTFTNNFFCWEFLLRKEKGQVLIEWKVSQVKMQYPYPEPFSKNYFSKNNKCDLLQEKGPSNFAFPTAFRRSQLSLTEFQRFWYINTMLKLC